ncbi:hypothetical protein [Rhizobium leguminosarum]|uniref:hypothetical protein n=1 Tax=Rhizobium leguminosarum TaxID=384 RepID=UPI001D81C6F6|nr:hypothetical protein [Rhizobium leguminosarum]
MEDQKKNLGRRATEATVKFVAVLAVMIFVAAGSLSYWQGWLFFLNFFAWIVATTAYFLKYDRALLEQRLHVGPAAEREPAQKRIQLFNGIVLIALFIGSALDYRFGGSAVPASVVIFGDILVAAGFAAASWSCGRTTSPRRRSRSEGISGSFRAASTASCVIRCMRRRWCSSLAYRCRSARIGAYLPSLLP